MAEWLIVIVILNPHLPSIMKRPNPRSLPTSLKRTVSPNTDILVQLFSDSIFVVITQRAGKLGTLLRCIHEHSVIDNSHTYHVETLMGKRDDNLAEVYARQITERIASMDSGGSTCPPVLLGIALKDGQSVEGKTGPESFHHIIGIVLDLYREGIEKVSSSPSKI